jgi:hypothetical protein
VKETIHSVKDSECVVIRSAAAAAAFDEAAIAAFTVHSRTPCGETVHRPDSLAPAISRVRPRFHQLALAILLAL